MNKIDVIIATYNRIETAIVLANDLLSKSNNLIANVILVDSSDNYNGAPPPIANQQIIYLFCGHKNQPFQRFLGYTYSKADILLFLECN